MDCVPTGSVCVKLCAFLSDGSCIASEEADHASGSHQDLLDETIVSLLRSLFDGLSGSMEIISAVTLSNGSELVKGH